LVRDVGSKQPDEFWGVPSVHVEGEQTAILATDRTDQALQLCCVVIPDGAIPSQECLYSSNIRIETVGIKIKGGGEPELEMNRQPV